nr:MAG TPA: hypothetical protein [Caudoviricetes sp.]
MLSFSKDTLSYSENVIICWKICEKTVKPHADLSCFRRNFNRDKPLLISCEAAARL